MWKNQIAVEEFENRVAYTELVNVWTVINRLPEQETKEFLSCDECGQVCFTNVDTGTLPRKMFHVAFVT